MKLYGAALSPYVRKVQSYLAERGMEAEMVAAGIGSDDPGFRACSPLGKMPALQDGDFGIADSSAIITWLEAKYGESGLMGATAEEKARVHFADKFADTVLGASGTKIFFNRIVAPKFFGREGNEAAALEGEAELGKHYDYLEGAIQPSGYLVGDRFSFAEIAILSLFGNLKLLGFAPDPATYPKCAAWMAANYEHPSIAAPFAHAEKIFSRVAGDG